ncbi:MAG: hypothetical protein LBP59_10565 [Planctomycetaceae bacterium]|jgi:hypothetical protein|nr:hypothetical protein [Planctomycetaceae bacterium]
MRKCFIIISVSDRFEYLNALLNQIRESQYKDWSIALLYQDYLNNVDQVRKDLVDEFFVEPIRLGCNKARIMLLQKVKSYDVYCNLDDDIELTQWTRFDPVVAMIVQNYGVGFVLTNWARTYEQVVQKSANMVHRFDPQILLYQGGGMLYNDTVAELMRKLPLVETVFDEGWSLTSYLQGYTNYRYSGSLSVHHTLSKGGMHDWYKSVNINSLGLLYADYLNYRKTVKGETHIPLDADVKPLAKEMHRKARSQMLMKLYLEQKK